ncbi:MAG TPA: hypothetical protein PLD05_12395, partial [Thermogutta sp.]|nr:hypothetical protein [Thermogutta sp.]
QLPHYLFTRLCPTVDGLLFRIPVLRPLLSAEFKSINLTENRLGVKRVATFRETQSLNYNAYPA